MMMPKESSVEAVSTPSVRKSTRAPVRRAPKAEARALRPSASAPLPRRPSAPTERGTVQVTRAAANESAAVSHSDGTPPTAPMRNAAAAGPTMVVSESSDCVSPMKRWRSALSRATTAGSSASRAVMPGMSPTAPSRPSATNQPKLRPQSISTTGMSATLAADTRSERMEMSRRLKRSRAAPPTTPMTIWGTAQMSASVPAASASPVVASRISGSATAAMELPRSESAFDAKKRGAMRAGCGFVCMGSSFLFRQKGS